MLEDVENYGVAFFCHVFGEYLGREEGAEEVEVEDEFYAGGVKIEEGFDALCCAFEVFGVECVFGGGALGVVSAGAVQENVDCAEFLKDGFARGFEACLVENVCADGYGCAAVLGDFIDYFLRGVDSEVADGDFRAARGGAFANSEQRTPPPPVTRATFPDRSMFNGNFMTGYLLFM